MFLKIPKPIQRQESKGCMAQKHRNKIAKQLDMGAAVVSSKINDSGKVVP